MSAARAARLGRLAQALDARRRLAAMRRAALDAQIEDIGRREVETLDFAATVAGERAVAAALVRRLAALDARRAALKRDRVELIERIRRDRRLSRGAERLADRLAQAAARQGEAADLEALLDAAFARPAERP